MARGARTKSLHKIRMSRDESRRNDRIKEANIYSFFDIWNWFYEGEEGEEGKSIHDFKTLISEEVKAIDAAHYPEDGSNQHQHTYEHQPPQKSKKQNKRTPAKKQRTKVNKLASNFFAAEDDFIQNHAAKYYEYLMEKSNIEDINDEKERTKKLEDLKTKYKGSISALEKCQELGADFEKYEQTIKFLNEIPESVLLNMVQYNLECEKRGKKNLIDKPFEEMFSQPHYKSTGKESENGSIINEHRFNIGTDNDSVTHSILNLNGTGLNITFIDGKVSLLFCDDNMTQDQIDALADYCFRYGIKIEDFGNLKGSKVVDNDNKEVGDIEAVFAKSTKKAIDKIAQNAVDQGIVPVDDTTKEVHIDPSENFFGEFIPEAKALKPFQPNKAIDAAKKLTAGGGVVVPSCYFGTTVVRFYSNEDDVKKDCRMSKDGEELIHTKKYAVTFNHSRGEALFYLGKKTQLSTGDIRVGLEALKAQGYKYFEYPSITSDEGFGAGTQKAMFEASVKTGMPLLLRGPSGRGCDIGAADIDTILEFTNKNDNFTGKHAEKAEYLMRWYEQLQKYVATTNKHGEFATVMDKVKQQASFTLFQASFKGLIEDEIKKNIGDDGKWDNVDVMSALYAYGKIVDGIKNGYLGGKRYNPLDEKNNGDLIMKEFTRLRQARRPIIEKEISDNLSNLANSSSNDKPEKVMNTMLRNYKGALGKLVGDLKGLGVDVGLGDFDCRRLYNPELKKQTTSNETNNVVTPAYKKYAEQVRP